MPAIITHHLYGEDASNLLPEGILTGQEDLLAFLLGNQGPDPLWSRFRTIPLHAMACHQLATRMHDGRVVEALLAMREAVFHLHEDDRNIGRAFVLGMAAHYLLDSITHPLIYALQAQLASIDPSLAAASNEVHAIIEADIDSWILWQKRQQTVLEAPCSTALALTDRIARASSAIVSQVAWEVFGIALGADEYGHAVADYRLFYKLIDPPATRVPHMLARAERLVRPESRLQAQTHRVITSDNIALANLEHRVWRNPATGERSTASFADLFHDALLAWPTFSQRLIEGNPTRLNDMIANINYNGVFVE